MKQHCEIRLPAAPQDPGTENYSTPKHARTHAQSCTYVRQHSLACPDLDVSLELGGARGRRSVACAYVMGSEVK
jgi:hypothetical protein